MSLFLSWKKLSRVKGLIAASKFSDAHKALKAHIDLGKNIHTEDSQLRGYIMHYRQHLLNILGMLEKYVKLLNGRVVMGEKFDYDQYQKELDGAYLAIGHMGKYFKTWENILSKLK